MLKWLLGGPEERKDGFIPPPVSIPTEEKDKIDYTCLCAICHDVLINAVTIDCGHNFCKGCLLALERDQCPTCNKNLHKSRLDYAVNYDFNELLRKWGGPAYADKLKDCCERDKEIEIIGKYVKSVRYRNLHSLISSWLEQQAKVIELNDVYEHVKDYPIFEIDYILHKLIDAGDIIGSGTKIIPIDGDLTLIALTNYLSQNLDTISDKDLMEIVIMFMGMDDDGRELVRLLAKRLIPKNVGPVMSLVKRPPLKELVKFLLESPDYLIESHDDDD